ncbi:hypothetical protein GW17_00056448 [Ensete ventricosum]|nr:hypothetical protein GW17_00056448 [Ensete ventricosum]
MAGACRGSAYVRRHRLRRGHKGQPRSHGCHLQGRLPTGAVPKVALPTHEVPPESSDAYYRGGCSRRQRAALPPSQGRQRRRRHKGGKRG